MQKISTVLFDFDGTIMNTNQLILDSWQHTFRTLEGRERPVAEILSTFGEPLEETIGKVLPQFPKEQAIELYRSFHRDHFVDLISLFPGMDGLVRQVKEKGYKTGLVTSRLANTTYLGLNKYNLAPCFDCIVTADDTGKHKPDPEPVRIALSRLHARPEEALMLGDTKFDMQCGKNAGVKTVMVAWSLAATEEERMGANGPDAVIHKPEELLALL